MARILVKTENLYKAIESGKAFKGMGVNEEKAYVASKLATLVLASIKEEVEYMTKGYCHSVKECWCFRNPVDAELTVQWGAKRAASHGVRFDIIGSWFAGMAIYFDYGHFSYHNCLDLEYFTIDCDLNVFANELVEWVLASVIEEAEAETTAETESEISTGIHYIEDFYRSTIEAEAFLAAPATVSTTETENTETTTETETITETETESTVRLRKMIHRRARDKALLAERQLVVSRQRRAGIPRQT